MDHLLLGINKAISLVKSDVSSDLKLFLVLTVLTLNHFRNFKISFSHDQSIVTPKTFSINWATK